MKSWMVIAEDAVEGFPNLVCVCVCVSEKSGLN